MMDCILATMCKALAGISSITTFADYFPLQWRVAVFYLYSDHFTGAQGYTQHVLPSARALFVEILAIVFDVN